MPARYDSAPGFEYNTAEATDIRAEISLERYLRFPEGCELQEITMPGSILKGLVVRLADKGVYSGKDILSSSGLEGALASEMFEVFKKEYAFLMIKGVALDSAAIEGLEAKKRAAIQQRKVDQFYTFDQKTSADEQELHHDGVIDPREVFSLYHPYAPYAERTNLRKAKTQLMDAAVYWRGVEEFIRTYDADVKRGSREWPIDDWKVENMMDALENPDDVGIPDREEGKIEKFFQHISDPLARRKMIALYYVVNIRFPSLLENFRVEDPAGGGEHELEINQKLHSYLFQVDWEEGDLLYVNNVAVVHGRAFCDPATTVPASEVPVVRMELDALSAV